MRKALASFLFTAVLMSIPPAVHSAMIDVAMRDTTFQPPVVTISVGDTVRWTNYDTVFYGTIPHSTTSGTNCTYDNIGWDSGTLLTGQTYTFTFTAPGTYPYFCSQHCLMARMTGTVIVNPAPPASTSLPVSAPSVTQPSPGAKAVGVR